jgi:hypothetical protein
MAREGRKNWTPSSDGSLVRFHVGGITKGVGEFATAVPRPFCNEGQTVAELDVSVSMKRHRQSCWQRHVEV